MGALKALVFDVDGTLADTEMAHLAAFNHAFAEEGRVRPNANPGLLLQMHG